MKTCKDCIYFVDKYVLFPDIDPNETWDGFCQFNPKREDVLKDYWCGQLKEKVHVISDFENISHNPLGHKVAIPTSDYGDVPEAERD